MDQIIVFATLGLALVLFAWGKLRHDIVSIICLLILVLAGIVPAAESFAGFAHPAVITVAMILVVSKGLQNSGLIDSIGHQVLRLGNNVTLQIAALCGIVCIASAFMNNVGALAILMPVAIHIAGKSGYSPSIVLMPIAFASLLGGMTTLIGTPPNIIVSTFRAETMGAPFGMFDFSPVGAGVAIVGLAFITFIGWRLIPKRVSEKGEKERFRIEDYITEVYITEESKLNGLQLSEIKTATKTDIQVLSIVRDKRLLYAPAAATVLLADDILSIESDADTLKTFLTVSKTTLVGKEALSAKAAGAENIASVEAVIMANSPILRQTASGMRMRTRYGVNLLAISRQDQRIRKRLDKVEFMAGDVLLLQGDSVEIYDRLSDMGCLPLADRGFTLGQPKKVILALAIFSLALALIISGLVQVQVAFTIAAVLMVLSKMIPLREIYTSIDWPVIVLLGALLPVGAALESTGGAELIAGQILHLAPRLPLWGMLAVVLIVTMTLSDVINNAATVVLMAPISLNVAKGLGVSPDPFLIAVAVGASCAFLTPIGHQSNTLVMGPGGYKFTDYWRMGLPLEILIVLIGVPLIMFFWPL